MAKFCANGHQMEDSWEICPYCQKTGFDAPPPGKTRIESDPVPGARGGAPVAGSGGGARRTVVIGEKPAGAVIGWFVAMNGSQMGEDFRVREGHNVLGSAPDCEIVLDDGTVSAKHASLKHKDGKFWLTDLDSTNGTFVNEGTETIAREEIKDGDTIRLGKLALKFKCL
ncbi:MAG: FHA domain-containing protein [Candidatus Acidiferrales bacterium]